MRSHRFVINSLLYLVIQPLRICTAHSLENNQDIKRLPKYCYSKEAQVPFEPLNLKEDALTVRATFKVLTPMLKLRRVHNSLLRGQVHTLQAVARLE